VNQTSVKANGEIGEAKRAAQNGQDQAQEVAKKKATIERGDAV